MERNETSDDKKSERRIVQPSTHLVRLTAVLTSSYHGSESVMSEATNGSSAGEGNGQSGEADSLDLDGRQTLKGRERPQAIGSDRKSVV